jgi:anti-sigma-K factor RskA
MAGPEDISAAEYAFGLLDGMSRSEFEARLKRDETLRREVAFWEDRMATALLSVDAASPPRAILTRVEASLFGRQAASQPDRNPFPWKKFVLGLVAFKLSLLVAWYVAHSSRTTTDTSPPGQVMEAPIPD